MILYETPSKIYRVYKQDNSQWRAIFCADIFHIAMYSSVLASYNERHPEAKVNEYYIRLSFGSFEDTIKYLCYVAKAISKDEMKEAIRIFLENSSLETLDKI